MATTRDIITRALRRLRVIPITQDVPGEYMTHCVAVFNDMLDGYERGLQTETIILIGNTANGSKTVADLDNDSNNYNALDLVPGMNISGTGIATSTRILNVLDKDRIELDTAATANGTGVSLTFALIPFDDSLTEALISVLAMRLTEDFGQTVSAVLARDARRGQAEIDGYFLNIPTRDQVDRALVEVPSSRFYDGSDDIVNG